MPDFVTPGVARSPTSLEILRPRRTDRATLTGQTGTGKTTLARYLLAAREYKVIADYKGRIDWPEYKLCRTLKQLVSAKEKSLLYKPNYRESIDEESQSSFWEFIFKRGGTTAYIDELAAIANRNTYPYYYGACLMRGRELGIEVWSATQRPTDIPQIALSEAEHFYVFYQSLPQDREKVEAITGIQRSLIATLSKREFLYRRQGDAPIGPCTLQLPST